ncbi:hypothetical protein ACJX0J_019998, partial [Zea mays]
VDEKIMEFLNFRWMDFLFVLNFYLTASKTEGNFQSTLAIIDMEKEIKRRIRKLDFFIFKFISYIGKNMHKIHVYSQINTCYRSNYYLKVCKLVPKLPQNWFDEMGDQVTIPNMRWKSNHNDF